MNKNSRKIICLFLALILCLGLWMPVTAQVAAEPEIQAETTLDYDSDGYYTIRSTVSGTPYYLSVQNGSTADGTPVVLKSGTITDSMLWRLETAASGNIKIIPKVGVNLNRAMAVQYSATAQKQNGLPIQERIYSNDSYYSDEWIFSTRYFTYVNYYDTSFANANLQYRIEEANQFASDIFAEFNTPFMYGGTSVYSGYEYGTSIALCKSGIKILNKEVEE